MGLLVLMQEPFAWSCMIGAVGPRSVNHARSWAPSLVSIIHHGLCLLTTVPFLRPAAHVVETHSLCLLLYSQFAVKCWFLGNVGAPIQWCCCMGESVCVCVIVCVCVCVCVQSQGMEGHASSAAIQSLLLPLHVMRCHKVRLHIGSCITACTSKLGERNPHNGIANA